MRSFIRVALGSAAMAAALAGCRQVPQYGGEPSSPYAPASGPSCSSCSSCGAGHANSAAADVWATGPDGSAGY
jgi:hypothetical protein